ncbi:MAG: glycolate oxidase subunit GlcE [Pseudomonadota bacterium]
MNETLSPKTAEDVLHAVRWAQTQEAPLEIVGHGTKRGWGRPGQSNHVLDMSALSGIELYESDELVLSALPGTPMAEIETTLADAGQALAFEPPDFGPLFGQPVGQQSFGGTIACNLAGPRRVKAGAARDHLLGFHAVTGRGEAIKSGGRVVKNVTGYDLSKLVTGSFGTLGVLTEATIKVLPRGEKTRTVLLYGQGDAGAIKALAVALNGPHEISAAAHLPPTLAGRSSVSYVIESGTSVSAVRVEGPGPSVEHRCGALRQVWAGIGDTEELHGHNSQTFWSEVRDVAPLLDEAPLTDASPAIWRISVAPTAGAAIAEAAVDQLQAEVYFDWGGGLVWVAAENGRREAATILRAAVAANGGGHTTLIRGSEALRRAVPVFEPQPEPVARVTRGLKEQFDPNGILNPGRMYEGV